MDNDQKTEATAEDLLVQLLCSTLDNKAQDAARRVDAGIYLLGYFARQKAYVSIDSPIRAKHTATAAAVRKSMTAIALDEEVALEQRLRAAGASL